MNKNKRIAAVGMTAGLLAGGAAGLILEASGSASAAQTTPVTTPSDGSAVAATDATTAATPGESGTTASAAEAARDAAMKARLDAVLKPLVDDGTLTQEQADKVVAALIAAGPVKGMGGVAITKVAEVVGVTAAELRTEIQSGKTVAEIAVAKGKTGQAVIDALVADAKTALDAKVTAGTITQVQADTRLAVATARITAWVNETQNAPLGGPGGKHGGDRRGGGQHGMQSGGDEMGGPLGDPLGDDAAPPAPANG